MSLSCQEVTEGNQIGVTIDAVALREITVRGSEVVLARTVYRNSQPGDHSSNGAPANR